MNRRASLFLRISSHFSSHVRGSRELFTRRVLSTGKILRTAAATSSNSAKSVQDGMAYCNVCKISVAPGNLTQHQAGRKHKNAMVNAGLSLEEGSHQTSCSQEQPLTSSSSSLQVGARWCEYCQTSVQEGLNWEQHIRGKKHIKTVQRAGVSVEDLGLDTDLTSEIGLKTSMNVRPKVTKTSVEWTQPREPPGTCDQAWKGSKDGRPPENWIWRDVHSTQFGRAAKKIRLDIKEASEMGELGKCLTLLKELWEKESGSLLELKNLNSFMQIFLLVLEQNDLRSLRELLTGGVFGPDRVQWKLTVTAYRIFLQSAIFYAALAEEEPDEESKNSSVSNSGDLDDRSSLSKRLLDLIIEVTKDPELWSSKDFIDDEIRSYYFDHTLAITVDFLEGLPRTLASEKGKFVTFEILDEPEFIGGVFKRVKAVAETRTEEELLEVKELGKKDFVLLCGPRDQRQAVVEIMEISQPGLHTAVAAFRGAWFPNTDEQNQWEVYRLTFGNDYASKMDALSEVCVGEEKVELHPLLKQSVVDSDWNASEEVPENDATASTKEEAEDEAAKKDTLNISQKVALERALKDKLTLIQGPPGTGKTKVLTSIIASLVARKHRVLMTADSNTAVDLASERLDELGIPCIRVGMQSSLDTEKYAHVRLDSFAPMQWKSLIENASVVCATCIGASGIIGNKCNFDTLVIDEATQATQAATLAALLRLRPKYGNVVLIGDEKQLPPTVLSNSVKDTLGVSLFEHLLNQGFPKQMLLTQYRMHPVLRVVCSELFYDNKLEDGVTCEDRPPIAGVEWVHRLAPVKFIQCSELEDEEEKFGWASKSNLKEAEIITDVVEKILTAALDEQNPELRISTLGIVSPYMAQTKLMKRSLSERGLLKHMSKVGIMVSTVDGFQGQECDVLVISGTRSNSYGSVGFMRDSRRFNVMFTRAKRGLVVVGNRETLERDRNWRTWFRFWDRCVTQLDEL